MKKNKNSKINIIKMNKMIYKRVALCYINNKSEKADDILNKMNNLFKAIFRRPREDERSAVLQSNSRKENVKSGNYNFKKYLPEMSK